MIIYDVCHSGHNKLKMLNKFLKNNLATRLNFILLLSTIKKDSIFSDGQLISYSLQLQQYKN